jgi:hypothetical protein
LQEQIDREAIAISVKASKLTARVLAKAFTAVVRKIQKAHHDAQTPQGRQSVGKLMNHNVSTSAIPIAGDRGLFDRVARKFRVDYAFHKTGPEKYLLLFKSGQTDAVTAALSEYASRVMGRARHRKLPVMEQYREAASLSERQRPPQHKERAREKELMRE